MEVYRRRISREEAAEGYVLVEKSRLAFFPAEGTPFTLGDGEAVVASYACTCRGPDKPHRHSLVRLSGLEVGSTIEIVQTGPAAYTLRQV